MSVSMIPSIVRVRAKGEDEINKYQTILTTKSFVLTLSISTNDCCYFGCSFSRL